jgi:hypothetical protein
VSNPGLWAAVPCGPLCKDAGWNEAQRCVRSTRVIVLAPSFDLAPGVVTRKEPVGVQTFVPQPSVERFNQRVVGRFPWPTEVDTTDIYHPVTLKITAGPMMNDARGLASGALFANGKVLIAGGISGLLILDRTDLYTP